MAGDLLDRILSEIRERKQAAQAAYEEAQQLEAALAALDAEPPGGAGRRRSKEGRAGRRGTPRPAGGRARRGANREAILAAVGERPGATARELADVTGIARTTVASTVTRLAAAGVLERSELPAGGSGSGPLGRLQRTDRSQIAVRGRASWSALALRRRYARGAPGNLPGAAGRGAPPSPARPYSGQARRRDPGESSGPA